MSRSGPRIDSYDEPRTRPQANWILIEDSWPPSSVPVLVFLTNGTYAVLNRHRGDWGPGEIPCDESIAWVHLPKPPDMIPVARKPAARRKRLKTSKRTRVKRERGLK